MEKKIIDRALSKVARQEIKLITPSKENIIEQKMAPIKEKIAEKIPDKAIELTEAAFVKGFTIVFEKGNSVIAKSFDEQKHKAMFYGYEAILKAGDGEAALKGIDKSAKKTIRSNKLLTIAEGGVLGSLGIGLPDIPIYIGVLLKSVYEIALSYGFDYRSNGERTYILNIISMAAVSDERREVFAKRVDNIGAALDSEQAGDFYLEPVIESTAKLLTERMVTAKFVQGLPIVGVIGAATNFQFLDELNKVAHLKYKKRFLARNKNLKEEY